MKGGMGGMRSPGASHRPALPHPAPRSSADGRINNTIYNRGVKEGVLVGRWPRTSQLAHRQPTPRGAPRARCCPGTAGPCTQAEIIHIKGVDYKRGNPTPWLTTCEVLPRYHWALQTHPLTVRRGVACCSPTGRQCTWSPATAVPTSCEWD